MGSALFCHFAASGGRRDLLADDPGPFMMRSPGVDACVNKPNQPSHKPCV
jgi:hypothetical protein